MSNHYVNMFRYNIDANQRVWECAMTLSDELYFKKLDYSQGAIFSQLIHTMGVEYWWLHFLRTGEIEFIEELDAFEDRAYFRAEWNRINAVNLAYLEQVTPEQLDKDVKPPFWATNEGPVKCWQGIMQVLFHSMDHRAQTLAGLHGLGAPTVEQDYLYYLLAKGGDA